MEESLAGFGWLAVMQRHIIIILVQRANVHFLGMFTDDVLQSCQIVYLPTYTLSIWSFPSHVGGALH
jgi:hypothetical protein